MTFTYPTSPLWYLLVWGAACVLGVVLLITAAEWRETRHARQDQRAMSRAVGRMLRDAARGEDHRSWR